MCGEMIVNVIVICTKPKSVGVTIAIKDGVCIVKTEELHILMFVANMRSSVLWGT